MDLRKVQKTGGSTFIVSLPKDWAVHHNVQAGDTLGILRQQDGSLRVTLQEEPRREVRTRRIDVNDRDLDEVSREVIASYLAGYDTLDVRAQDRLKPELRDGLRQLTRKVIGPEIVDEASDQVVVQDLLDPAHLPIRKGVQRMYFIARSMHHDAVEALGSGDTDLARDVVGRDDDVDRLFWMVSKQYHLVLRDVREGEKIGVTPQEGLNYLLVARILERIADHATRIAASSLDIQGEGLDSIMPHIQEASDDTLALLEDAFDALFHPDVDKANRAIADSHGMESRYDSLLEQGVRLPGRDAVTFAYILESLVRTASYATDIAEVAINYAVGQGLEDEEG